MKHRSKFLVIVDDSEELNVAIRFAAKRSQSTKGGITLLNVIEQFDPQQWQSIEDIILQEAREKAQDKLQKWSKVINDLTNIVPELIIKEGPLVSLLAGQKSGKLPVPIVIIPQGLSDELIDDLASRSD